MHMHTHAHMYTFKHAYAHVCGGAQVSVRAYKTDGLDLKSEERRLEPSAMKRGRKLVRRNIRLMSTLSDV